MNSRLSGQTVSEPRHTLDSFRNFYLLQTILDQTDVEKYALKSNFHSKKILNKHFSEFLSTDSFRIPHIGTQTQYLKLVNLTYNLGNAKKGIPLDAREFGCNLKFKSWDHVIKTSLKGNCYSIYPIALPSLQMARFVLIQADN